MNEEINQEQRAYLAWNVLVEYAQNSKTITYKELGEKISIHHRAVRFVLDLIQDYCMENQLPPLTILVLNKNSNLPGSGFVAYDIENSRDGIEKVYKYIWKSIPNPFTYAEDGTTKEQIVKKIINEPDNSKTIYTKIKVRGVVQTIFRKALLEIYENKCAVCKLSFKEVLEACHIIPYSISTKQERLDVRNGILLCSNHHNFFDKKMLTINDDYTISFSNELINNSDSDVFNTLNFSGRKLNLPKQEKHRPRLAFIKKHRENNL
ncbi:MAG: hypothetical protein CSA38_02685 [Flavobacteriales bacterium]|nr:MAG: hypothetical protein CSA38_02685 [Flavobacteriales bacterium]